MIDLVHIGQIIVGAHAMLGHHAAHGGAIAEIIVLLDSPRFRGRYIQPRADDLADPCIDLLPQIDVMRIQRVVEIEHPGVDVVEGAGGVFHWFKNLSTVVPAKAGTHTPRRPEWALCELPSVVADISDQNSGLWLWVPAFAGTTMELFVTASRIGASCHRLTCRRRQIRSRQNRGSRSRLVHWFRTWSRACTAPWRRSSSAACP